MCPCFAEMRCGHHRAKCAFDRPLRIGQEIRNTGQRLVLLGIQNVKNSSDQQGVASFLPVIPPFQRPFGIDQHVGDILHVTDFPLPSPHFQKRVVGCTL